MLKIIKMEYFDEFQCLMDKCPDNCCDERWTITIDNATYEKYQEMGIPDLDNKITKTEPHILIKNGRCPFIMENGLCTLHKEYGEEVLSNTCMSYPRFVSQYGDLYVENLGLSCPAVSDWLVSLQRLCKIKEQIYYEDVSEKGKCFPSVEAEIVMKKIVDIVKESSCVENALRDSYCFFGADKEKSFSSKFCQEHILLLKNISICYLFERIMLKSQQQSPDYIEVLDCLCDILHELELVCVQEKCEHDNNKISKVLYRIMRIKDHGK